MPEKIFTLRVTWRVFYLINIFSFLFQVSSTRDLTVIEFSSLREETLEKQFLNIKGMGELLDGKKLFQEILMRERKSQ